MGITTGLPFVVAVMGGVFIAPRTVLPPPGMLRLLLRLVIFGVAAAELVGSGIAHWPRSSAWS